MQDRSDLSPKCYRARWVLPGSSAPIHNGLIEMAGGKIVTVRKCRNDDSAIDLGNVAIMPCLVNAHTHLEFSDLESPIGRKGMSIADWLPAVVQQRQRQQLTQQHRSEAILRGLRESIASGVRTIGEIATEPWPIDLVCELLSTCDAEVRLKVFGEILGLSKARGMGLLNWFDNSIGPISNRFMSSAISPHSPYSVPDSLLGECVSRSVGLQIPIAMHFAESREEREFVESGRGALRDAFATLGLPGLDYFPSKESMLDRLRRLADASTVIVVHGNYLSSDEINFISEHKENMTVVYCPRTHDFFGHERHPCAELVDRGIPVALGTDSRASNPDLNLLSEIQFVLCHRQDIHPRQVLKMGTSCGAVALGYSHVGNLEAGYIPEFVGFETVADTEDQLWEALSNASGFVTATV